MNVCIYIISPNIANFISAYIFRKNPNFFTVIFN